MNTLEQRLRDAADNIERARNSGIAEHLAGWEHRVIREAADAFSRLTPPTSALDHEGK